MFDSSRKTIFFVQRTPVDVDATLPAVTAPELPKPLVPIIGDGAHDIGGQG